MISGMKMFDTIPTEKERRLFQIGSFVFEVLCPKTVQPPENFLLFEIERNAKIEAELKTQPKTTIEPQLKTQPKTENTLKERPTEYTYHLELIENLSTENFPELLSQNPIASREDLLVYSFQELEARLLKARGSEGYYAYYKELSESEAIVYLNQGLMPLFELDTVFSSLFALERRMLSKNSLVLHCACLQYGGEAILFTAPSGVGKSTQASLWEKYKNAHTINGDRILLQYQNENWSAMGWPVCGSSEICQTANLPIRAIVLLSQEDHNTISRPSSMEAFTGLYSQITVNGWNQPAACQVMDLLEQLILKIPVFHLGCTISKEAVELCESALQNI